MTDRELLELAAKAAGYPPEWKGEIKIMADAPVYERLWNPLADDGDALRLAVKLELHIDFMHDVHVLGCSEGGPDRLVATRRAIVRSAAEIGKAMP